MAGLLVAGAGGAVLAADLEDVRGELERSRDQTAAAQQRLEGTSGDLAAVSDRLEEERAELAAARQRADDVAARETAVGEEEERARKRSAQLGERERALDTREASLDKREDALTSYDVGHPLLDSIYDDGTWVVGRDIKPGTWSSGAYDTGCAWSTSDGRSGAGDGSYRDMKVSLEMGQTFTVRGCAVWSNYF